MRRIVVGCNGGDSSRAALEWVGSLAGELDMEVVVAYAVSSAEEWELAAIQIDTDPLHREFSHLLETDWTEGLRKAGVRFRTKVVEGRPTDALMQLAHAEQADMIAIGMGRHGTMSDILFGNPTSKLVHKAVRPVIVVPADWAAQRAREAETAGKAKATDTGPQRQWPEAAWSEIRTDMEL